MNGEIHPVSETLGALNTIYTFTSNRALVFLMSGQIEWQPMQSRPSSSLDH